MFRLTVAVFIWLLWMAPLSAAEPTKVRAAVERALPLLQRSATTYTEHRECFACHHQAAAVLACSTARAHGFAIDADVLDQQVKFTLDGMTKGRDNYRKGKGLGGQVATAGYALWTLEAGKHPPDETTAAMAEYVLLRDEKLPNWKVNSNRPPSEASDFTTTYLALRGLRAYGTAEQQERIRQRTEAAKSWLLKTAATETEERVFRLWGLKLTEAEPKELQAAAQEILASQRDDGGWAQLDQLASDAYATGSALAALHEAAGLATDDPAYQRGVDFLLKTQREDGSWRVESRSRPFQTYFESGFPHGKDQFISMAASGWAVMALARTCPAEAK